MYFVSLAVVYSPADGWFLYASRRKNVQNFGIAIRIRRWQVGLMKKPLKKSTLLTAYIKELDKPYYNEAASQALLTAMQDPSFWHKPVYAWLLKNHAEVEQLRARLDRPRWESIAKLMAEDGVVGARGAPPNANSVRRVWKRVCRDKIARDAWQAAKSA